MNNRRWLRPVLAGLLGLAIQACATYPKSGQSALTGTWTNSVGSVWTVKADGSYDVDLNKDGKHDAWGKMTVDGDTMTIWRTGGIKPHGCGDKGVYKFTRSEDTLQFTLVKDSCKVRKQNALQMWRRKSS
ncbi:MAG: hypothetical protein QOH39_1159 [Verrucomicrobiota bacterium]|jgi:hypothetical protein